MDRSFSKKRFFFIAASLISVAILGIARLSETFYGDQAMFTVYARAISEGAVLYGDIWDVKQPGIFIFYLLAGLLFGFSESGIHFFELLYWLAFSAVLIFSLRWYFQTSFFLSLAPLFTVGYYYLVADSWRLTQVESLIGFPILLAILLLLRAGECFPRRVSGLLFFLSGLAWSFVLILKSAYLLVCLAITAIVFLFIFKKLKAAGAGTVFRSILLLFAGILAPMAAIACYFIFHGVSEELFYVTFLYPRDSVAAFSGWHRLHFLRESIYWFFWHYLPLLVLIALGTFACLLRISQNSTGSVRSFVFPDTRSDLFTLLLIVWVVSGLSAILVQAASWWGYHFMLLFAPLGLLAAKSLESFWFFVIEKWNITGKSRFPAAAVFAVILFPAFLPVKEPSIDMAKRYFDSRGLKIFRPGFFEPHGFNSDQYEHIGRAVAFLPPRDAQNHNMFVCANPLYYHLSDSYPTGPSNGWSPEFFMERQWRQFEADLSTRLPVYLIIDEDCSKLIQKHSPETIRLIRQRYERLNTEDDAEWFVLAARDGQ